MNQVQLKKDLEAIFGNRVTTSDFERWFYTYDFLSIPDWIRAFFKTMPSAVVKPKTTDEIASLLSYCSHHQIGVVPRGSGTSALFGAVPKKGGVLIDLTGLTQVTSIDKNNETVTSAAGITWWELDRKLKQQELTLRSYPSSARSATLGGWLMSSGRGIGTLKYGQLSTQLVSAEIVLADGTINNYIPGQGMEWFPESEGMLGIVTQIKLKVRKLPPLSIHYLVYFKNRQDAFEFLNSLAKTQYPLYAVELFDYQYLNTLKSIGYELTNAESNSCAVLITIDGDAGDINETKSPMENIISQFHGEIRTGAEHAWQHRFNTFIINRGSPGMLPGSLYLPLNEINQFFDRFQQLTKRPVAVTGHLIDRDNVMLIPMVSAYAGSIMEYTRALHTPWELTNLALSLGGKPGGGLGLWNSSYKKQAVLKEMVERIKHKKQQLDPNNILNPGMWLSPPLFLSPSIFPVIMTITSKLDKMLSVKPEKPPEQLLLQETLSCTQCGYCMNYCPTKQEWLSSTPRGRLLMTRELVLPLKKRTKITQDYINSIYQCNTCGRCKVDCSVDIKSPELWLELRNELTSNGYELESIRNLVKSLQQTHNIAGKPNNSREDWTKKLKAHPLLDEKSSLDDKKDMQDIVYFTGCVTALYPMVHDIAISFVNILNIARINCVTLGGEEWCCGYPLLTAGHPKIALEFMEHNIARIKNLGISSVALTCPGCYQMWKHVYPRLSGKNIPFDIMHSTQLLEKLIKQDKIKLGKLNNNVTYHDPCDIGRNSHIYNEPRYIISQIPDLKFIELTDSREYCSCCGAGGDVMVSNPELARKVSHSKVQEIVATGAGVLVTACPSCIRLINMARQEAKAQFNIWDITQLVWKSVVQSTGKSDV